VASSASVALLTNDSVTSVAATWPGGMGLFSADGTFSGATLTLQWMGPTGLWYTAGAATTLTAAGGGIFYLPPGQIRVLVAGGPPSGVSAVAARVPT
jgi:hypothetical protein